MDFRLPKDLSFQFDISLKTVYNYIAKYPSKITIKKEYWKTLVSLQDFTEVFQKVNNKVSIAPSTHGTKIPVQGINEGGLSDFKQDSELQEAYNIVLSKNEELEVVLDDKSRQLAKYGELFTEAKREKKELEIKYDDLQRNHVKSIENHAQTMITKEKQYSRLMIITSTTIVILIFLSLLYSYPHLLLIK